jgi:hypothetical protein
MTSIEMIARCGRNQGQVATIDDVRRGVATLDDVVRGKRLPAPICCCTHGQDACECSESSCKCDHGPLPVVVRVQQIALTGTVKWIEWFLPEAEG